MKSDRQRIDELEAQVAGLLRANQSQPARPAMPLSPPAGWWLGISDGELTQGGTVVVSLYGWNDGAWEPLGKTVTARDFFLNVSGTIPAQTAMRVDFYRNLWVVTNWYCLATDVHNEELAQTEAGDILTTEAGEVLEAD